MHFTHKKFEEAYLSIISECNGNGDVYNEDAEQTISVALQMVDNEKAMAILEDGTEIECIVDESGIQFGDNDYNITQIATDMLDDDQIEALQNGEEITVMVPVEGDDEESEVPVTEEADDEEVETEEKEVEADEEEADEEEADEEEADEEEAEEEAEEADEADDEEAEGKGKFISFFTMNQDLINALEANEFSKIIIVVGDDDKAEELEIEATDLENLAIEDLEEADEADEEAAEDEAEDEADKAEEDADMAAAAADIEAEKEVEEEK